jgi:hypothetical protein
MPHCGGRTGKETMEVFAHFDGMFLATLHSGNWQNPAGSRQKPTKNSKIRQPLCFL